jgi:uncharacterized protein YbjT (DUF2867 family)
VKTPGGQSVIRIALFGGSGLIGRALRVRLQQRGAALCCPLRRLPPGLDPAAALLPDGPTWSDALLARRLGEFRPGVAISCLGTTRRAAGSIEAFAAIDCDLVLRLFSAAAAAGAQHAVLVSSIGADAASGNDYLRIKGEVEQAVQRMGFRRVDLLRPSLLLGERAESRPLERLGIALSGLASPLLQGGLRRYRPIAAERVAAAAEGALAGTAAGVFVHDYDGLMALAQQAGEATR